MLAIDRNKSARGGEILPGVGRVPVVREAHLFGPEHQAACRAGGCEEAELVDETPESFAGLLRALGGDESTREKLAALVGVER